jgi:hypothetical protein
MAQDSDKWRGCGERGNESPSFIRSEEFLELLSDRYVLKKSTAWSVLLVAASSPRLSHEATQDG